MENKSGISPCGHRVLVLPEEVEEVTESGIVIPKQTTQKEQMAQIRATVVAVGAGAWRDTTAEEWAVPGDTVIIGKYAGLVYEGKDGINYRICNDLDVVAKLGF